MPIKLKQTPQTGVELSARGENIYEPFYFNNIIANPNDFFGDQDKKSIIDKIREMNACDPRLVGLIQTRKLAVLKRSREIIGDSKEADFIRSVFQDIKEFHKKLKAIMSAYDVGFSVSELIWDVNPAGQWIVIDILDRFQGKFVFGYPNYELRLLTIDNYTTGIDLKEKESKKWIVCSYEEQYGNRYGRSIYEIIYWYWFLKKHSLQFWSIFTERLASPLTVVKTENENDTETNDKIEEFIKDLKAFTGIRIPSTVAIEFIQASQGGVTTYEDFIRYLDHGIAISILGQASSIDRDVTGSYARDKVQDELRQDICDFDILNIESLINDTLIRWLVDFNFSDVKEYPKWRIVNDDKIDVLNFANAIKIIKEAGHDKIPLEYVNKNMGIPSVTDEEIELLKPSVSTQPYSGMGTGQFSDVMFYAEKMAAAQKTYKEEILKLRS